MIDLGNAFCRVNDWILSAWDAAQAPLYQSGEPYLLSTCFAVLAAECTGALATLDESKKAVTAAYLLERQSEPTGWFEDVPIRLEECGSHRPNYIRMQHAYFALHALDALGVESAFPIRAADPFLNHDYLLGWLDAGPWQDPWLHSNNIMFALTFLQTEFQRTGREEYLQAFDWILDYLDERQDSVSGLWQPEGGVNDRAAVFAAYHFFPYYVWRGRPIGCVDAIIDTTLGIQLPNGFFVRPNGGACEDLDAVHTLVLMAGVSSHKAPEVRDCLGRCASAILASQQPDGGFLNYSPAGEGLLRSTLRHTRADERLLKRSLVRRNWKYSGWAPLSCPRTESDMWSAWFRPLCLRLIAELYPEEYRGAPSASYRSAPGLGYHTSAKSSSVGASQPPGCSPPGQPTCSEVR